MYPQTNLLINPNKKLDFNGVVTMIYKGYESGNTCNNNKKN
jgi:hypothetical protein